jgi:hypothetical protein
MKKLISVAALGAILLAGVARAAETGEVERLRAEIKALGERVQAMEKPDRLFAGGGSWVEKLSFSGDFRYRHEMIKVEPADGDDQIRHRHRIRARLALKAKVNDEVYFKLRLSTGSGDPVSGNQSLDGGFSKKPFVLDQAYVGYKPEAAEEYGMELRAGKMGLPFYKPVKSQLIFDGDLSVEGISAHAKFKVEPVEISLNVGGFWVEEHSSSADNGLFGAQLMGKFPIGDSGVTVVLGLSAYIYANEEEEEVFVASEDPFGNTATQVGADYFYDNEYNLLEVFGEVHFKLAEIPLKVYVDFVNNNDPSDEDTGFLVGLSVGKKKQQWDWDFKYFYRALEMDAVVGAFCDSDFGGGGTNNEGHCVGFGLRLLKNTDLGVTYLINERFVADDDDDGTEEDDYNRLQIDLKFKF